MEAYLQHLLHDPALRPVLAGQDARTLKQRGNVCLRLCASVLWQQLSTKVAKVLWHRFLDLYGGAEPEPAAILETPFDTLRGIGLSNAKTGYVRNVAQHFLDEGLTDAVLAGMDDAAVYEALLPIKGVGRWTVEMLLMFTLGREDVFPADDLGIQQAMARLYPLDASSKKALRADMERIAAAWSPYRTYAAMHLWRWKDSNGAVAL